MFEPRTAYIKLLHLSMVKCVNCFRDPVCERLTLYLACRSSHRSRHEFEASRYRYVSSEASGGQYALDAFENSNMKSFMKFLCVAVSASAGMILCSIAQHGWHGIAIGTPHLLHTGLQRRSGERKVSSSTA